MISLESLPIKELGLIILGACITVAGFFAKRNIQRDSEKETLELQAKALALHRDLKSEGLGVDDLVAIQRDFTSRRHRTRQREDELIKKGDEAAVAPTAATSQRGMNRIAAASLEAAQAGMKKAIVELGLYLSEHGEELQRTQEAWKNYAEAQAELWAVGSKGGSIYPLLYCGELERLTVQRTAELQEYLEDYKAKSD